MSGRLPAAQSGLELGLGQTNRALAFLPLTAFLHELNTLKTLEDRTLTANGTGCFKCGVLGHIFVSCVKWLYRITAAWWSPLILYFILFGKPNLRFFSLFCILVPFFPL